ncbi:hypothetical protein RKD31_003457 [Streptomyces sp. SAI-163]
MAALTPVSTVGFPAKRSFSRTATSWARITPSAAAITAGSSRVKPAEPWVSTTTSTPSSRPAFSRDSAAM